MPSWLFEPSLAGYVTYSIGAMTRYFLVSGGLYWLFYVKLRQRCLAHHIQSEFPNRTELWFQIRWSLLTISTTGLFAILLYSLIESGSTRMYFDIAERGWGYFALSILLGIFGYDTYIYWQHWILHSPWLFRHVHLVHHRVRNPTPFTMFAFHPFEHFFGNAFYLVFLLVVPIHPLAFALVLLFFTGFSIIGHSGYEFFPAGFTRHPIFGWVNTSTHHNMHHTHVDCNYGNWFNHWDRIMGTNHPRYHDTFEGLHARSAGGPTPSRTCVVADSLRG